jgi:hypothetical protein
VREEVKNRIIVPEVERRMGEIQSRIAATMQADYAAYRKAAGAATQPTTSAAVPASSLGVPYDSFEYLQKLAENIQRDFKVLPTVRSLQEEFRDAEALRALSNVGQARAGNQMRLPEYLTTRAEAFAPADERNDPDVLSRFEPSQPLRDDIDNIYIVRVTDAEPAHAPKDMSLVAEAVKNDYVAAQSFERAKEAAAKLLAASEQAGSLTEGAKTMGRNVVAVGPVSSRPNQEIPNFPLTSPSSEQFVREAFKLLSRAATQPAGKQPLTIIELPQAGRVVVVELAGVKPAYEGQSEAIAMGRVRQGIASELRQMFELQWFDPANIRDRLDYESDDNAQAAPAAPAQPRPPMF